jgi:uncharacterized protein involved in exopolysaccharide biosynthesis
MTRYLEVFFRHKVALVGLMLVSLVVSTLVVMIQPRTYHATASLWFDHSPILDSSSVTSSMTLADQATAIFHELINTRDFDVKVGRRGPLADYFDSSGNFPKTDPVTPIIHWLEDKPQPTGAARTTLIDDGMLITLQKNVLIEPSEPQVVGLTFDFTDPAVAAGTLKALVDQFEVQVKATALVTAQGSVDFYNAQVNSQLKDVQTADAGVARYLNAHPEQRVPNAPPDVTYAGLQQVDDLARQRFATLTQKLGQARLDVASLQQPGPYGFRIIDLPQAPLSSSGMLRSVLLGVGGGIGVGLLLISVICFLLVTADNSFMRGSDLQSGLRTRVIGEIPILSSQPRRADAPRKALPPNAP